MTIYEKYNLIAQLISGVGMIIVSIGLGIFTYRSSKQQIKLSEQNLKVQIYKERLWVYKKLENALKGVDFSVADQSYNSLEIFAEVRDEVVFLFDKEIQDYLLLIINKYEDLARYSYDKTKDDNYYKLVDWFINQFSGKKELRQKFKRYLDLSNYGLSKE